jgi:regulatory protein
MTAATDPADANPADVRAVAVRLLARREYARQELGRRLTRRGFPEAVVETVLEALVAEGLLSDERFAESFVRAKADRGQGPFRIARELGERGVAGELVDEALAAAETDWRDLARRVRVKRFGARVPEDYAGRARQMRFLHYRGFTEAQIRAALGDTAADD